MPGYKDISGNDLDFLFEKKTPLVHTSSNLTGFVNSSGCDLQDVYRKLNYMELN
jgi:hypothetical protein